MLTIMAVVTCAGFLQTSDGLTVMLKYAEQMCIRDRGEAFIEFLSDFLQDVVFSFFGERLSVVEVPCFLVEASLAVMLSLIHI